MSNMLTLFMIFDDLTTEEVPVSSRGHARDIVNLEGDHVWDWYIKEDQEYV